MGWTGVEDGGPGRPPPCQAPALLSLSSPPLLAAALVAWRANASEGRRESRHAIEGTRHGLDRRKWEEI